MKNSSVQQVKEGLLRLILDRSPGGTRRLPSIRELATTFGACTATVQKAVTVLVQEGRIESRGPLGLFARTQSLPARASKRIGLLSPNAREYLNEETVYPGIALRYLKSELGKKGYSLVYCPFSEVGCQGLADYLDRQALAGVVLFEFFSEQVALEVRRTGLPLVGMDCDLIRYAIPSVCFDNSGGAFQLTKYLIGLGHQDILFLHPFKKFEDSATPSVDLCLEERQLGFRLAMQDAGRKAWMEEFDALDGYSTRTSFIRKLNFLFDSRPAPTAIIGFDDWTARVTAEEVMGHGFEIPKDLSIAGFGNYGFKVGGEKTLASVWMDSMGLGQEAARLLLGQLKGEGLRPQRTLLPTRVLPHDTVMICTPTEVSRKVWVQMPKELSGVM